MSGKIAPSEPVKNLGGRYASALGIDLAAPDAGERFKTLTSPISSQRWYAKEFVYAVWPLATALPKPELQRNVVMANAHALGLRPLGCHLLDEFHLMALLQLIEMDVHQIV